jgi:hypothetical protein
MDQRATSRRMPNSIKEKAQISIDPNAMGVKTKSRMSINFIILLSIIFQQDKDNLPLRIRVPRSIPSVIPPVIDLFDS